MEINSNNSFDNKSSLKEKMYDMLGQIRELQVEISEKISYYHKTLQLPEVKISYTGNLVSNKISELSNMFNKVGLSFYSSYLPSSKIEVSSDIGDAITFDLFDKLNDSTIYLQEYVEMLDKIVDKAAVRLKNETKPLSRLKRILTFNTKVEVVTEEEKAMLMDALKKYTDISDEIWRYNLKDDFIPALMKYIPKVTDGLYNSLFVKRLMECIIPELRKLNMEEIIDPMIDEISEYFEKLEDDFEEQILMGNICDSEYSFEETDECLQEVSDVIQETDAFLSELEEDETRRNSL